MTKRRLSDSEDDSMPRKKKYKVDSSYCKYGCGRKIAGGKTRNGNKYDTCCRNCSVFLVHSNECNIKFNSNYTFKLLGSKARHTQLHCGREETSKKYVCCINNKYYYRIWKGLNYNSYVLIHPLKYVTNSQTADKYMHLFEYQKDENDEDHILNDKNKSKIIESIQKYDKSPSLSQFIADYLKSHDISKDVQYTANSNSHDDIFIDGVIYLGGISWNCHKLRYKDVLHTNYVSQELYNTFPFSDIESKSSCIFSNCSCDTLYQRQEILIEEMNEWLKKNGCDVIPYFEDIQGPFQAIVNSDDFYALCRHIMHEHIYYNKLKNVFENKQKLQLFDELHRQIEWNEQKQKPYFNAIQLGWKECTVDVINIILMMIQPMITSQDLEQRRLTFWKMKTKEIYDEIDESDESDEENSYNNNNTHNHNQNQAQIAPPPLPPMYVPLVTGVTRLPLHHPPPRPHSVLLSLANNHNNNNNNNNMNHFDNQTNGTNTSDNNNNNHSTSTGTTANTNQMRADNFQNVDFQRIKTNGAPFDCPFCERLSFQAWADWKQHWYKKHNEQYFEDAKKLNDHF